MTRFFSIVLALSLAGTAFADNRRPAPAPSRPTPTVTRPTPSPRPTPIRGGHYGASAACDPCGRDAAAATGVRIPQYMPGARPQVRAGQNATVPSHAVNGRHAWPYRGPEL